MLTDVHSICGYLIGKYLFQKHFKNNTKYLPESNLTKFIKNNYNKNNRFLKIFLKCLYNKIFYFKNLFKTFFKKLSFEQKYLLISILINNLPDLDLLYFTINTSFTFLKNLINFKNLKNKKELATKNSLNKRRTFTHSIYINLLLLPFISIFVQKFLGLKGLNSYLHCIYLVFLNILSHLFLDFITNFGVALFYPFSKKVYTLGIVTSFDFTLILFFYGWLFLTKKFNSKNNFKKIFCFGILSLFLLIIWKRAMMCEIFSRYYFFMESQKKKNKNNYIWLQPSNLINGQFTIMKYDTKLENIMELKTVQANQLISTIHWISNFLGFQVTDVRQVQISSVIGPFLGTIQPREYYPTIYLKNRKLLSHLLRDCLPSIVWMILSWIFLIYLK
ncbi:hypothetical protein ABK040_002477 [Willaertia magna]